MRIAHFLR